MRLKIFLGFLAICFLTQTGFDFAHSKGYEKIMTLEDYKLSAWLNLIVGILCLYFISAEKRS